MKEIPTVGIGGFGGEGIGIVEVAGIEAEPLGLDDAGVSRVVMEWVIPLS